MVDLTPFLAGIDLARKSLPMACYNPREEFIGFISGLGYKPQSITIDKIERITSPEDKPNKKNGWYIYREIPDSYNEGQVIGIASYGCWKRGISDSWCSKSTLQMSVKENAAYQQARETMRAAQDEERSRAQSEAALKAFSIWQEAKVCDFHTYLAKKQVSLVDGLKIALDGRLIIPVIVDNHIVTLQFIDNNGEKRFLTNGRTKGAWFKIEGDNNTIYVAEGFATGASVHMATGSTVYIAFNAGNLFEVTMTAKNANPQSKIIIAGDDDVNTTGNPGRTKASQAANGLGVDVALPPVGFVDFNDLHVANGIDAVKACLTHIIETYKKKPKNIASPEIDKPTGILGYVYDYYNATSGNKQEGFAIQTALALGSIVLARGFKTSQNNYSTLYLLNVAKSGTGKEHARTIIEKILQEANCGHLIAGDGYTSAGAVFSALLQKPKHLSIIDELGRYLEASKDLKSTHQREANTKLMEAIGRTNSVLRPPSYSTMTLKKDETSKLNRVIFNPAITLYTMTTPDTLFNSLDMSAVKDGFINRFIISFSDAERQVRKTGSDIAVPQAIIDWINAINLRYGREHLATEESKAIILEIDEDAMQAQYDFQQYCIDQANYLERFHMAELPGRSNEMAMRISLIIALAENPAATTVSFANMNWAIAYVKNCLMKTMDKLKISISSSPFEHAKKEILYALRELEANGITWAKMQKTAPFSQHKPKDLKEILLALKDAELAAETLQTTSQGGRPTQLWQALK